MRRRLLCSSGDYSIASRDFEIGITIYYNPHVTTSPLSSLSGYLTLAGMNGDTFTVSNSGTTGKLMFIIGPTYGDAWYKKYKIPIFDNDKGEFVKATQYDSTFQSSTEHYFTISTSLPILYQTSATPISGSGKKFEMGGAPLAYGGGFVGFGNAIEGSKTVDVNGDTLRETFYYPFFAVSMSTPQSNETADDCFDQNDMTPTISWGWDIASAGESITLNTYSVGKAWNVTSSPATAATFSTSSGTSGGYKKTPVTITFGRNSATANRAVAITFKNTTDNKSYVFNFNQLGSSTVKPAPESKIIYLYAKMKDWSNGQVKGTFKYFGQNIPVDEYFQVHLNDFVRGKIESSSGWGYGQPFQASMVNYEFTCGPGNMLYMETRTTVEKNYRDDIRFYFSSSLNFPTTNLRYTWNHGEYLYCLIIDVLGTGLTPSDGFATIN